MQRAGYAEGVFINCPFSPSYLEFFYAIVFTVFDCGFQARCAKEINDGGQVRINKIFKIVAECQFGIHDISHTDLDEQSHLPKFNMPFELGVFLGAKKFGNQQQNSKNCLILDREKYRYQSFISDISGQDVRAHDDRPKKVVRIIRDWLSDASKDTVIPGGREIFRRFKLFEEELPALCAEVPIDRDELTYNDYTSFISAWLRLNT